MAKWDLSKLPQGRKPLGDDWFANQLHPSPEAIVRAALERAANLMLDGRAYAVEEHGERSLVVADMDARHEAIRSLASNPTEVAAIIKKAGEDRG